MPAATAESLFGKKGGFYPMTMSTTNSTELSTTREAKSSASTEKQKYNTIQYNTTSQYRMESEG
jgi:hypothetical protein